MAATLEEKLLAAVKVQLRREVDESLAETRKRLEEMSTTYSRVTDERGTASPGNVLTAHLNQFVATYVEALAPVILNSMLDEIVKERVAILAKK